MALYDAVELEAPTFRASPNGMQATRKIRIPDWDNVTDYMKTMLGEYTLQGSTVYRTGPATFPGKSWLILRDIEVRPMVPSLCCSTDIDTTASTCPEGAACTLNYSTVEYDQTGVGAGQGGDDDRNPKTYMTHRVKGRSEVITHPYSVIEWADADADSKKDVPPSIKPAVRYGVISHELTWHFVPDPPFGGIYSTVGTCNSDYWPDPDNVDAGFPPETLLFADFSATRKQTTEAERHWELTYTFLHRNITQGKWWNDTDNSLEDYPGWTCSLRQTDSFGDLPLGAEWHRIRIKGASGQNAYLVGTADFDTLFNT